MIENSDKAGALISLLKRMVASNRQHQVNGESQKIVLTAVMVEIARSMEGAFELPKL